jgi:dipeptidyl aminopeptidase/acylaminoacyl peptidase
MRTHHLRIAIALCALPLASAFGQGTLADYRRADSIATRLNARFVGMPTAPEWIGRTTRFWYRTTVTGGSQFTHVDAATAVKSPLFDHARLAAALSTILGTTVTALTLPFTTPATMFTVATDVASVTFNRDSSAYRCDLVAYTCARTGIATTANVARAGGDGARNGNTTAPVRSPDGTQDAFIVNHNLVVRAVGSTEPVILSYDGIEGDAYTLSSIRWSPDSRKIAAFRVRPGYRRMIPYIESSPTDQVQPKLTTRLYEKPGDPRDRQVPSIFTVAGRTQFRLDPALIPQAYDLRRPQWRADSRAFTFEYNERGHQRYQLLEMHVTTGVARIVIDEREATFVSNYSTVWRQDINDGAEILWMSERDGWKHLWLYDGTSGRVKNQVTTGEWVVRGVDTVDVAKRQIYFRASGMYRGKDPYLVHAYRINFDGTGLVALTQGDGTHTVSWSPDREYYVDTWSRVDMPPVMELHRASDRSIIAELERTDVTVAEQSGWRRPEVFSAKGRDGVTDIWGIIIRPSRFDPRRAYPVIENIYAGPHDHFVPKAFSAQGGMQALAELGFIVVQIDGMGTAQRSKAFHNVAWKNIADAGFPDRILWHRAVAAKYASYDTTRVGIYGTSAGGQNSTGALLFHPEFYKVAVSAVGCHDNRMDKISWNEQWMGYPVGPEYAASSNVEHAGKLRGRLLLVVGELDTNVDPQSTMQVINALVKADKQYDFLFLPGAGHGSGGAYGSRVRNDYFVRHLLGVAPPDWNAITTSGALGPGAVPGSDLNDANWVQVPSAEGPVRAEEIWR